jgi:hypothetical protein
MDMSTDGHHSFPRGIKRVELKVTPADTMVERGLAVGATTMIVSLPTRPSHR